MLRIVTIMNDITMRIADTTGPATSSAESLTIPEILSEGFTTMFLGMATVFVVLFVIWCVISLLRILLNIKGNKNEENVSELVEKNVTEVTSAIDSDEEIVAAITASLALYLECPTSSFRVVSFKKR